MKIPILIVAGLFFFACTTPQPQPQNAEAEFDHLKGYQKDSILDTVTGEYVFIEEVNFGQNLSWVLDKNEEEGVVDSLVVEEYFQYNDIASVQLPLNRYVVADNYKLYIGIVMGTSVDALSELYQVSDSAFIDMKLSDDVVRILNKHESVWSVRYLIDIDRTYLFSFVSKDSVFVNDKFENYESPSDHIVRSEY